MVHEEAGGETTRPNRDLGLSSKSPVLLSTEGFKQAHDGITFTSCKLALAEVRGRKRLTHSCFSLSRHRTRGAAVLVLCPVPHLIVVPSLYNALAAVVIFGGSPR